MPTYRFSRVVETDIIEVQARNPQEARSLLDPDSGFSGRSEFVMTIIEEVSVEQDFSGYREETTEDIIEKKRTES